MGSEVQKEAVHPARTSGKAETGGVCTGFGKMGGVLTGEWRGEVPGRAKGLSQAPGGCAGFVGKSRPFLRLEPDLCSFSHWAGLAGCGTAD